MRANLRHFNPPNNQTTPYFLNTLKKAKNSLKIGYSDTPFLIPRHNIIVGFSVIMTFLPPFYGPIG